MTMTMPTHVPVMRDRVIALLAPALEQPGSILVDATLGLGGHAEAALTAFPDMRLIGLDRDTSALDLSRERLAPFAARTTLVHAVYDEIGEVLDSLGIPAVHGILFDLGVSSMQLDEADRGFSYAQDAPLDMRMDQSRGSTAAEVLNTYAPGALVRVLREYGEERFATNIVSNIVKARPLSTTRELADIVRSSIPAAARRTGGNPAKRTFQALRIEVNGELDALRNAIPTALKSLTVGGRIVVMSYQSLEDRIVKQALAEGARSSAPAGLPVVPDSMKPWLTLITRGGETPDAAELEANPRSASVRVRAAERVAA
jgi:16S rRNA (cytosine1402-N4)-methyltransferase